MLVFICVSMYMLLYDSVSVSSYLCINAHVVI